jgi:hypothetical protein
VEHGRSLSIAAGIDHGQQGTPLLEGNSRMTHQLSNQ